MDSSIYRSLGQGGSGIWELAFALAGKTVDFNLIATPPRFAMSPKVDVRISSIQNNLLDKFLSIDNQCIGSLNCDVFV